MTIRHLLTIAALTAGLLASGCDGPQTGPIAVSAIGGAPRIVNPNLEPPDPPSAFLLGAAAQGLVRFDETGQVEPALAQSWIVSDDGLRYTFRLGRAKWTDGRPVTAEQVAARLRAALSRASRNRLKPLLGAVEEIVAMTDSVLEISLRSPRPNFLQLLAQPDMAVLRNGRGTGPFHAAAAADGGIALHSAPDPQDEEQTSEHREETAEPAILLRGERAAIAVARFRSGKADLVTGGTANDLPIARADAPGAQTLLFDPAVGLLGLRFVNSTGALGDPTLRRAISMAIDRPAITASFGVPNLQPLTALLPPGLDERPDPAQPDWAALPMVERQAQARQAVALAAGDLPVALRVAMPAGPGYRLLFAHLRRDWRAIGVSAVAVAPEAEADLRLLDEVAPTSSASWYLRLFLCEAQPVCIADADPIMAQARAAPDAAGRRAQLGAADRLMTDATLYIPISSPVRWSLVSPRLAGFRPNSFARHPAVELVEQR